MKEEIEIEYKILIDQKTFNAFLKAYPMHKSYTQTNYYFSHPLFIKNHYMLRVRYKNESYEMTLKRPMNGHRLETNCPITKNEFENFCKHLNFSNEITDILIQDGIDLHDLKQSFSLTTIRHDINEQYGILSIDENHYNNIIDYEIEYEVFDEDKGLQHFHKLIQPFGLTYTKNCLPKVKRALDSL